MNDSEFEQAEADLKNRFNYHKPDPEAMQTHQLVRDAMYNTARFLESRIPPSRELSLALTHLEQVMFWSNAGVARLTVEGERR